MHGLYINMDRSPVRRSKVEAEIAAAGLAGLYRRIRGVPDPIPYNGCTQSHINAIVTAAEIGGIVHIIEDDVLMSDRVGPFLTSPVAETLLETYDIVYLSMWVDPNPASAGPFTLALDKAKVSGAAIVDMNGPRIGAMDSYVVAQRSIPKVVELMATELRRCKSANRMMQNDTFIDRQVKAGVLKAATVVPFLTCIDIDTGTRSAIQVISRDDQQSYVRLRTTFFVNRDRQESLPMEDVESIVR